MKQKNYLVLFLTLFVLEGVLSAQASTWLEYSYSGSTAKVVKYSNSVFKYSGDVTIPETITRDGKVYTVTGIGYEAFYKCDGLTSISIPKTMRYIEAGAFYDCTGLTKVHITDIASWCQISYDYSSVHSYPDANPLNYAHYLYLNGEEVKDLVIPDSVTTINQYAFYGGRFRSITIPETLRSINQAAFNCSIDTLKIKDLSSWCKISISGLQFFHVKNLIINGEEVKDLVIPSSISTIRQNRFYGFEGLTSVTIPPSVTYVGENAFCGCSGLNSVSIPNSIKSINSGTFSGCSRLTKVTIPNTITSIGKNAFYGCSSLTNIVIPKTISSIGESAFKYCSGLEYVIMLNDSPISGSPNMFPSNQLIYVPDVSSYKNDEVWKRFNIQGFYQISPLLTIANIVSNQDSLNLKQAVLKDKNGGIIQSIKAHDNNYLTIMDLMPDSTYSVSVTVAYEDEDYEIDDTFITNSFTFRHQYSNGPTQTTYSTTYTVDRDGDYMFDACGLNIREGYSEDYISYDGCGRIIETSNDSFTIEYNLSDLTPNSLYYYNPWVQYKGKKYSRYTGDSRFTTKPIDVTSEIDVTPTSVYLTGSYSAGDAHVTDTYITFNGVKYETLYQTGLDPKTRYNYTYTFETTSGNQVTSNYFSTPALSMVAQPVKMLTNTTALFEAQTNMIDEETMVGFEWRRYDAPDEMPSTKVYSPVFGGKIAGTLKNLAENVYYKYRPFYTSNSGKSYYGKWVAFLTADAGVVYEPMVYTYNSPEVKQTEATLQGVALRGSEDITEQGFEYWKSGNGIVTKISATGERMSKKVSGLQSGAKYIFRAFLTAGGETHYGNEVEFVTLSNSLDVNIDGEITIADINAVIDMILTDNQVSSGDVNGDGEVTIADINTIIDAILSN